MSVWYEVDDPAAVELSSDGKSVEVLYSTDRAGNNYVEIPVEFIRQLLDESAQPAVQAKAEKRLCATVGCNDYIDTSPRKHCNNCLGRR